MDIVWLPVQTIVDRRGSMVVGEAEKNIPFDIKRVYCLINLKDEPRGFHAHRELKQAMLCLSGSCDVILDDGREKREVHISDFNRALLIDKRVWHEMHNFSDNCVLMVLASDYYNESDYIRDYDKFKDLVNYESA